MAKTESEQLAEVKALTMHEMVEDVIGIGGENRKLLYLTTKQASLVASNASAIHRMVTSGFQLPEPKLVIYLIKSPGLGDDPEEEESNALMDEFMATVLIPLAEETNALIICNAAKGACGLSSSFLRVTSMLRARWPSTLPFSVLSFGMADYYLHNHFAERPFAHALFKERTRRLEPTPSLSAC